MSYFCCVLTYQSQSIPMPVLLDWIDFAGQVGLTMMTMRVQVDSRTRGCMVFRDDDDGIREDGDGNNRWKNRTLFPALKKLTFRC